MDAHRVETLRVAVEHIDRHRGDFKELDEQKYMLSDLIKRHQLKYKPVGKPLTDLDVQTYRRAIENIAHRNGTKMKGKDAKITQVFLKGSRVLTKELLEKIGYTHTGSVSDSEQSEYDGDEDTSAETEAQRSRGTTEASTVHNSNIKPDAQAPAFTPISVQEDTVALGTKHTAGTKSPEKQRGTGSATAGVKRKLASSAEAEVPVAKKQESSIDLTRETPQAPSKSNLVSVESHEASKLLKLSSDALYADFNALWTHIQSFTRKLLTGTGLQDSKRPLICAEPTEQLLSIYQRLYGTNWKRNVRLSIQLGIINAGDILEACVAAGIYDSVFNAKLPWEGPRETMGRLSQQERYINQFLKELETNTRLHTCVWQAARNQVLDVTFQENVIRPIAEDLANNLMLSIDPQICVLGAIKVTTGQTPKDFWQQRHRDLTNIFLQALILKGQIEAAPDYYICKWVESSRALDRAAMEEVNESDGLQVVRWCVSPMVMTRRTKEKDWEVACPAKVFSRPKA